MKKSKYTQGSYKFLQYTDDLRRNVEFRELADKLEKAWDEDNEAEMAIYEKEIASKYGIDAGTYINHFMDKSDLEYEFSNVPIIDWDVCRCFDSDWLYKFKQYDDPYFETKILAFPVSIGIGKIATKRDVIDYIEKKWNEIEEMRKKYVVVKKKIRRRKFPQGLIDFVYYIRSRKADEIIKLLDEKFPKHGLSYSVVNEIIKQEKKRRKGNLIVGR